MLTKCLELAKQMMDSRVTANLEVKLGKEFSFTLTNQEKEQKEPFLSKKKSPSVTMRNFERKKEYFAKKEKEIDVDKKEVELSDVVVDMKSHDEKPATDNAGNNKIGDIVKKEKMELSDYSNENLSCSNFKCELCKFESHRKLGLRIHRLHKHNKKNNIIDDNYGRFYWTTGNIGTAFQVYLDVIDDIQNSDLTEEEKKRKY